MPGLGLTKLELFKWLSGKNLPQLKIQYGDCTLSCQIFLQKISKISLLEIHIVTFHHLYFKQ